MHVRMSCSSNSSPRARKPIWIILWNAIAGNLLRLIFLSGNPIKTSAYNFSNPPLVFFSPLEFIYTYNITGTYATLAAYNILFVRTTYYNSDCAYVCYIVHPRNYHSGRWGLNGNRGWRGAGKPVWPCSISKVCVCAKRADIRAKNAPRGEAVLQRYPYIKQLLKSDKINFVPTPSE